MNRDDTIDDLSRSYQLNSREADELRAGTAPSPSQEMTNLGLSGLAGVGTSLLAHRLISPSVRPGARLLGSGVAGLGAGALVHGMLTANQTRAAAPPVLRDIQPESGMLDTGRPAQGGTPRVDMRDAMVMELLRRHAAERDAMPRQTFEPIDTTAPTHPANLAMLAGTIPPEKTSCWASEYARIVSLPGTEKVAFDAASAAAAVSHVAGMPGRALNSVRGALKGWHSPSGKPMLPTLTQDVHLPDVTGAKNKVVRAAQEAGAMNVGDIARKGMRGLGTAGKHVGLGAAGLVGGTALLGAGAGALMAPKDHEGKGAVIGGALGAAAPIAGAAALL